MTRNEQISIDSVQRLNNLDSIPMLTLALLLRSAVLDSEISLEEEWEVEGWVEDLDQIYSNRYSELSEEEEEVQQVLDKLLPLETISRSICRFLSSTPRKVPRGQ
jgi:hypothetical protein